MIVGTGVDIVEVARIEEALASSTAMTARVFTEAEQEYCERHRNRFQHYAGRFAAKEAVLKALGTGWAEGIRWRDVETRSEESGRPVLHLHGKAHEKAQDLGVTSMLVTISHIDTYAVAFVILEA